MTQTQTNFLNQNGIQTARQRNIERFDEWMKNLNNKFYSDDARMEAAYQLID